MEHLGNCDTGSIGAAARRPGIGARVLLCVLTAWALLVVPDFLRVVRPLGSLGFAANNNGLIYDVQGPFATPAGSPAWQAGLREGARVDLSAMRCIPVESAACRNTLAVLGGMGGIQWVWPGRQVSLRIIPATGAQARNVVLTARTPPVDGQTRLVLLLNQIVAVLFILAAAWLVWTRPGPMTWGFFLYAMWFNPGQLYVFYAVLQEHPRALLAQEVAQALAQAAGYAGFVLFALSVPHGTVEARWRPVERALPALAVVLAALQLASFASAFGHGTEAVTRIAFLAGYAVDVLVLAILLNRRSGQPPQDYQRLRWVIWGAMIGLPAFIFADSNDSTTLWLSFWGTFSPPAKLLGVFYLLSGIFGYLVFEAVRRPRVINVAIPLSRITILTMLLSAPAFIFHRWIDEYQAAFDRPGWVWIVGGTVFVFFVGKINELAVNLAEHLFSRSRHGAARALRASDDAFFRASTLREIEDLVARTATQALNLASAAVFSRGESGFERHAHGIGWDASTVLTLDAAYDTEAMKRAPAKPWRIIPGEAEPRGFPTGLQTPVLVVPVADRLRTFALAFYGPHRSGADLDAEEQALLVELGATAAAAYARVEVGVMEQRVRELEARLAQREAAAPEGSSDGSERAPLKRLRP